MRTPLSSRYFDHYRKPQLCQLRKGVQKIVYENVRVSVLGEIAILTYRSKYEGQRTSYFLLMRVFIKRRGKWEQIAGQGFPAVPR